MKYPRTLIATAIALATLMVTGCDPLPTSQSNPSTPTPQSQVGRYTIIHSPQTEADVILLDTATGDTWNLEKHTFVKGDPLGWEAVRRVDSTDGYNKMVNENGGYKAGQGWTDVTPTPAFAPAPCSIKWDDGQTNPNCHGKAEKKR